MEHTSTSGNTHTHPTTTHLHPHTPQTAVVVTQPSQIVRVTRSHPYAFFTPSYGHSQHQHVHSHQHPDPNTHAQVHHP